MSKANKPLIGPRGISAMLRRCTSTEGYGTGEHQARDYSSQTGGDLEGHVHGCPASAAEAPHLLAEDEVSRAGVCAQWMLSGAPIVAQDAQGRRFRWVYRPKNEKPQLQAVPAERPDEQRQA